MASINKTAIRDASADVRAGTRRARALLHMTRAFDGWSLTALIVAALVALPLLSVFGLALSGSGDVWAHLVSTVLGNYIRTSLLLMLGVGVGVAVIGAGTAWLTSACRFPGVRVFEWALLLPLAVPAYIVAYIYTDILEFAGPVQGALRDLMGWKTARDYWFPEIRSLEGAIVVMVLTLYPYVYLLARSSFLEQTATLLDAGRVLGNGPWRNFFRVALPLARPAIVVGVSLALMETLNDFGTVDFFAVQTFTAGIYDVWLNMNSMAGAAQLATVLLLFVFLLITAERLARRGRRFDMKAGRKKTHVHDLKGWLAVAAILACLLPVLFGFLLPMSVLFSHAMVFYEDSLNSGFWRHAGHSLLVSSLVALVSTVLGLVLGYGARLSGSVLTRYASRVASIGYAVPGSVLAVGIMLPLTQFDRSLNILSIRFLDLSLGLVLSGTVFALIYGYSARFMALSLGSVESGLARITPSMDGAARTLGANRSETLRRVHLPLLRRFLLTAILIVFVDSMKELPITMLLRPFNFDTLATYTHQFARNELFEEAALGALAIVAAGILPVILLSRTITGGDR